MVWPRPKGLVCLLYVICKVKDLRQKDKTMWAIEGDENSKILPGIFNSIESLQDYGLSIRGLGYGIVRKRDLARRFFFPILYILAIEALNVVPIEAKSKELFRGVEVGKDKIDVLHFQFADDAFIMGEWSKQNIKNLSRIHTCFYLASGLKVNFSKSEIFGVGVNNKELNTIATSIGYQPCQFLCTYLGFDCFSPMSSKILRNQIACDMARAAATYSAYADDCATVVYFFEHQLNNT
ncbi:hypothetical protein Tco_0856519 [Tanacetum coccineum]|uniref:Reverse transcriptase domain-containing protein n=1 Tax=Tanacetum coccineum TaxID=301880 RepID=A0ABQ5B708_9ASTR